MNAVKQFWAAVVAVVVGLVGLFLYFFSRRGDEINALKTKIALATTEKETDLLEVEIRQARDNQSNLAKQNKELDKTLQELDNKRVELKEEASKLKDPNDIAKYWENN